MKKLLLLVLACGMFASAFSQQEPAEPCCGVIVTDAKKGITTIRDKITGRLYQFKANAIDLASIKPNDAVHITEGKVTAVNGVKRTYMTVRMDPGEPCCSITAIQPDPAEPCCAVVTYINNATNESNTFSIPKTIAATINNGQQVSLDETSGMAIVQSSYGNSNGQMNSFGYPATSSNLSASEPGQWVVTPVKGMKGVLGALDISFAPDVERNIIIHNNSNKEYITSVSRNDKSFSYAPGVYRLVLSAVPVDDVPIQKGHITRLKAGYLKVESEGNWTLFDGSKENVFTTGDKPKKMPLPVGSYHLKMGDQFFPFVIKDKGLVEL